MRILFILHSTDMTSGSSKSFMHMLLHMIERGIQPLVITPDKRGWYAYCQEKNIPSIALRFAYRPSVYPDCHTWSEKILFVPRLIGRGMMNMLATVQLLYLVLKNKPNIIHSNVSITNIGYYVARLLRIPHIWHIREYGGFNIQQYYYYPSRQQQLKRYKKTLSYTICITKDIQRFNDLAGWKNSKVIYNGVLPSNELYYNHDKKPYLLYVGRLEQNKGIWQLLLAYKAYYNQCQHPLPLHIAGEGSRDYTAELLKLINNLGINNQIVMLGTQQNVAALYKEAKAVIVPSIHEGFGRVAAEAMFYGCLVAGYNTSGTKEQLDNGMEITKQEIALRYTTQEQLVQHLIDITKTPIEYYEPMIFRAQSVVSYLYSTEQNAEQIFNLYNQILN